MIFETEESITAIVEWNETSALNARRAFQSRQADVAMRECLKCWNLAELEIEIENHHHLKSAPEILVSRSHSNGIAASTLARSKNCHSVGVDLEFSNRIMQKKSEKFFRNPLDTEMDTLRLWCLKEAIYKAIDPVKSQVLSIPPKEVLLLSDFWVVNNTFGHVKSQSLGTVRLETLSASQGLFYLALCFAS